MFNPIYLLYNCDTWASKDSLQLIMATTVAETFKDTLAKHIAAEGIVFDGESGNDAADSFNTVAAQLEGDDILSLNEHLKYGFVDTVGDGEDITDGEDMAETNSPVDGTEKTTTTKYAVIFCYSFDGDCPCTVFDTEQEAVAYLRQTFEEEIRIDTEENGKPTTWSIDNDGWFATITNDVGDMVDVTEFRITTFEV